GEAKLQRARAVHADRELGLIKWLVDAEVRSAGYFADLLHQLLREGTILRNLQPGDLQIDGRGQAKVQDLAYHVGRQVIELCARETAGERGAKSIDVVSGCVVLSE